MATPSEANITSKGGLYGSAKGIQSELITRRQNGMIVGLCGRMH